MSGMRTFRSHDRSHILFAHPAYGFGAALQRRDVDVPFTEARTPGEVRAAIGAADVMVVSGLWRNDMLAAAAHVVLVQSISVGIDHFDLAQFAAAGVRLANARGANAIAVAEHALALMLALSRQLHHARDNQAKAVWRPMNADPATREGELAGGTMLVVGLGAIGERIAGLGRAFGMRVIGVRQRVDQPSAACDSVVGLGDFAGVLPHADVVVLACPLTPATERLIDAAALARMRRGSMLINVARGRVVDEPALIAALRSGHIAAAGLDVTAEEPLSASSPLWTMRDVIITPHSAGETRAYEDRLIDLTLENIARITAGRMDLVNAIV